MNILDPCDPKTVVLPDPHQFCCFCAEEVLSVSFVDLNLNPDLILRGRS
jgi:hypothetical protein